MQAPKSHKWKVLPETLSRSGTSSSSYSSSFLPESMPGGDDGSDQELPAELSEMKGFNMPLHLGPDSGVESLVQGLGV